MTLPADNQINNGYALAHTHTCVASPPALFPGCLVHACGGTHPQIHPRADDDWVEIVLFGLRVNAFVAVLKLCPVHKGPVAEIWLEIRVDFWILAQQKAVLEAVEPIQLGFACSCRAFGVQTEVTAPPYTLANIVQRSVWSRSWENLYIAPRAGANTLV